jgi:ParB-like chromosome segregation protein Spo0J
MIEASLVEEAKRLQADGLSQRAIAAAIGGAPVAIDPHTRLEFHSLANLFPLIEDAEFNDLVADIKANGQREDIVLLDDKVLDGRNRYRACLAAGVAPRIVAFRPDVRRTVDVRDLQEP